MLKKYRPITPGTRQLVLPMNETLTRVCKVRVPLSNPQSRFCFPKNELTDEIIMAISPAAIKAEDINGIIVSSILSAIKKISLRKWLRSNMIQTAPPILLF